MTDGPYRSTGVMPDSYLAKERTRYRKLYVDLQEEFWKYKQKFLMWVLMPLTMLVCLSAMYWCLLIDAREWAHTMEPKHVCDPAPACELRLHTPIDSSRAGH